MGIETKVKKVVKIVADTKTEAIEQAFECIKESANLDKDLTLKDLIYDSIMRSMEVEDLMDIIQVETLLIQLHRELKRP